MPRFDTPLNTNDQSFDRVLNSGLPVALVIYDGAGLPPALDEALREAAKAEAGQLLITRLNAHENPQTATRAQGSLPVLIVFRDGQEISRAESPTPQTFRDHINFALGRGPRPADPQPHTAPRAANAPGKPVIVTDASFQQDVLNSDLPVLVDLWASWCGPCRMIAPVVEKLAGEYAGQLKVAKLNVDENPRTSGMFQVQSIPTLLMFRGGKLIDRIVGAAPEPMLRSRIETALRR